MHDSLVTHVVSESAGAKVGASLGAVAGPVGMVVGWFVTRAIVEVVKGATHSNDEDKDCSE